MVYAKAFDWRNKGENKMISKIESILEKIRGIVSIIKTPVQVLSLNIIFAFILAICTLLFYKNVFFAVAMYFVIFFIISHISSKFLEKTFAYEYKDLYEKLKNLFKEEKERNQKLEEEIRKLKEEISKSEKIKEYLMDLSKNSKFFIKFLNLLEKRGIFKIKDIEKILLRQRYKLLLIFEWGEKSEWKEKVYGSRTTVFSEFMEKIISRSSLFTVRIAPALYLVFIENKEKMDEKNIRLKYCKYVEMISSRILEDIESIEDNNKRDVVKKEFETWLREVKSGKLPVILLCFPIFISDIIDSYRKIIVLREKVVDLKKKLGVLKIIADIRDRKDFIEALLKKALEQKVALSKVKLVYILEASIGEEYDRSFEDYLENKIVDALTGIDKRYKYCSKFTDFLLLEKFEEDYVKALKRIPETKDFEFKVYENIKKNIRMLKDFFIGIEERILSGVER